MDIWDWINTLFDPETYVALVEHHGWWMVATIVLVECGVFFLFFLPGDYLLFLSGLFCSQGVLDVNIYLLFIIIALSAIVGSYLSYYTGVVFGKRLLASPNRWFLKEKNIIKTRAYFIKYGAFTLILCRFLPMVRTFAPLLAGVSGMNIKSFSKYNIVGAFIWSGILVLSGYYLGEMFPELHNYVEYVIFFFVGLTTMVLLVGWLNLKSKPESSDLK